MKILSLLFAAIFTITAFGQNHSKKPIRFIFESIHDHLGNLEVNSKRVQLFNPEHQMLYEADLYEGKELDEQFFYYNENGQFVRDHRIFHKDHESGDYRLSYDEKGNLIEETNINDLGEILERKTMTYDANGNMLTQKVEFLHHEENKMIPESYFEFQYEGNQLVSKTGWEGEKEDQKVTYKYAKTAKSEKKERIDADGNITESWEQQFDDKGRLLKDIHTKYKGGKGMSKTIDFTYDEYDHILTETMTKTGSTVQKKIVFEYTYDVYGNWIERKEKKYQGVKETEGVHLKRYIEYYEHDEYDHPPMELDESYMYEGDRKVFKESHVRINNNDGQTEWVVRRNGKALYVVDEYEYHEGLLIKINHLNNANKENAVTKASYDDSGNLQMIASYSASGDIDEKSIYTYDKNGVLVRKEEHVYDKTHGTLKLAVTEEYKYSSGDSRLIKMNLKEFDDTFLVTYSYDAKGNLIEELQIAEGGEGQDVRITYTYENGQVISEEYFEGNSKTPQEHIVFEYDENNELIRRAEYRGEKLHAEVVYVYFQ